MKKVILNLSFVLATIMLVAQSPQAIKYQAVARDASGFPIENQNIRIQFSINNNSPSGTILYQEVHNVTTNKYGLFNVNIGHGNVTMGNFNEISWGTGSKWLTVQIDPDGGSNYVSLGSSQLLSVPYALYADSFNCGIKRLHTPFPTDFSPLIRSWHGD